MRRMAIMSVVVSTGVPLLIILAMVVVGLELTPADLSRVLHYPAQVIVALLCQVLILPLLAAALILFLRPAPAIAGGLILAAAAPQAMTSNHFCLLARADVALSVTLTAASSVLAVASTPLIAGLAFDWLAEQQAGFVLPIEKVIQQIVTGLLFPAGVGMLVRYYAPAFTEHNRVRFQRLSVLALAAMLAIILTDQAATIERNLASIVVASALFTAGAAALGLGVAKVMSWNRADTITMLAAFPSRSLSVAALIALNVLGRSDFLSFAATFYLVQALLLVPVMLLARPASMDA